MPRKPTGNVRRRPNGSVEVRVSLGTDARSGKRITKSRSLPPGATSADIKALERQLLAQARRESGRHSRTTVATLLEEYVAQYAKSWTPTTMARIGGIVTDLITPALGDRQLSRLTTADVDHFYRQLRVSGRRRRRKDQDAGLSESTVRRIHSVLHAALELGVRWELLPSNPASRATILELDEAPGTPPTPEQAIALLAAADELNTEFGVYVRLAAASGARRGELCGLLRGDVNANGTLTIRRVAGIDSEGRVVSWERTKGRRRRSIPIGASTLVILQSHLERMDDRAAKAELKLGHNAYVFSDAVDCATPWRPDSQTSRWAKVRAGLKLEGIRLHDLRHYVGTQITDLTGSQHLAQAQLGHRHSSTTDRYVCAVPESLRAAAELLDKTLEAGGR